MNNASKFAMEQFNISESVIEHVDRCQDMVKGHFSRLDEIKAYNQYKVLRAMQENRISDTCFNWTTGYGYDDPGREAVEKVYARVFRTDAALVRPQIVSGTHAIALTLDSLLQPGDEMIYASGRPYDTMEEVIGLRGEGMGSLIEKGVTYKECYLFPNGSVDLEKLGELITDKTKMVCLQRSPGYRWRKALTISEFARTTEFVHRINPNIIIFADNCYGEFTDYKEPSEVGVDIMAGSLIKNPGGGLALCGGYIVGREDLIQKVTYRMTCPGIGGECGVTYGQTRSILQGLFQAPPVVNGSLKGAILCAKVFDMMGCEILPSVSDTRSDIIQAIKLESEKGIRAFCEGIQAASPVDSFVRPEPSRMPGYDSRVIMAAGAFVQGSSIELSADAPIREPYIVYYQGGLSYEHAKLGVMMTLDNLYKKQFIH